MKNLVKIVLLVLVFVSPFSLVHAGKAAPGIQKKSPPVIYDVSVSRLENTVMISWKTSVPTSGSIRITTEFEPGAYVDDKSGTRHEMTVALPIGSTWAIYTVESYSEMYGPAESVSGTL